MPAIESLISAGAKGFLITPSDSKAIVPAIDKAREAGLLVIALDTPLDPIDAADATFATDNFQAGVLIGQWAAKATLGDEGGKTPRSPCSTWRRTSPPSTSARPRLPAGLRHQGRRLDQERQRDRPADRRPRRHRRRRGGRAHGMENLLQKDPDINLVYTINEPAAAGAYEALKAAGKEKDALIVSSTAAAPASRR